MILRAYHSSTTGIEGREHMGAPPGSSLLGNYKGPTVPFKGTPPMSNVPLSSSMQCSLGLQFMILRGGAPQSFLWATLIHSPKNGWQVEG